MKRRLKAHKPAPLFSNSRFRPSSSHMSQQKWFLDRHGSTIKLLPMQSAKISRISRIRALSSILKRGCFTTCTIIIYQVTFTLIRLTLRTLVKLKAIKSKAYFFMSVAWMRSAASKTSITVSGVTFLSRFCLQKVCNRMLEKLKKDADANRYKESSGGILVSP